MLGFLIHHKINNKLVRLPILTPHLILNLKIRHTRQLLAFVATDFEMWITKGKWFFDQALEVFNFEEPSLFVRDIRRSYKMKETTYHQFWMFRAEYMNTNSIQSTPILRLIQIMSSRVITRFNDPFYFTDFLTLLLLKTQFNPTIRWHLYFPNFFPILHFFEWPQGDFCDINFY